MDETDQNRLTEGSVPRKMLSFALPIFLSNLFQQLYNAVDSLIVGNFIGSAALAAVGSSASMIMLLVGFINGVSLGAGVVIARFYGADDRENLSRALHTTVALGIAAGLVLTVVGVLLTPQILRWMGTPGDVIGNSIAYFRVYFLGSSAVVLYNMCASILQSVGDSRSPMKYLIFASLTNVVLDLLFVAVFRWGVASAALATILSQTLSALLAFRKLTHTGHSYRLSWRQVRFHGDMLRQVVYLGIPSGVQNSVISLANVIVQANINAFGSAAMAATAADSLSDVVATSAVLAGTLAGHFAHLSIDGWAGAVVAVFILKAGWGAAKDTINPLLGASPDPELVHAIREVVLSHPQVVGMHDLIIHDYGPGRRLCSFHAEVPQDADILEAHDAIDHIEREIQQKFGIETTAHMDPIATDDESVNRLREQVAALARAVEPEMTIHDFRVTKGPQHTNLIFDVVVPHRCRLRDEELCERLSGAVRALDERYFAVIQVDRAYVETR